MSSTPDPVDLDEHAPSFPERRKWFLIGASKAVSVPGIILCTAHVGFAGLAQEAGISMGLAVFMVLAIWALPGMVVLLGAVLSGAGLLAAAFAVALSSVRLTPMVVALVPEMRGPRTRRLTLYLLAHFVAVTSWVIAMETLRKVPRELRTSYYFGLGSILVLINMVVVALVYAVAPALPPAVVAGLFLLTPMYFLTSLWGSARETATYVAMLFGLVLGPLLHFVAPGFDLLGAGLLGGGIAYAVHLMQARRA
ncbi:AzlC family ABC transporter permease [Mesorhizobium sp. VNQ89]|uniref:AzlC family ABC transporter permease n=1 Tax=Mesorhizobium quangtriensis TaxID=3157709 RepID=UPI0032B87918